MDLVRRTAGRTSDLPREWGLNSRDPNHDADEKPQENEDSKQDEKWGDEHFANERLHGLLTIRADVDAEREPHQVQSREAVPTAGAALSLG
jgi:hypothetical protein